MLTALLLSALFCWGNESQAAPEWEQITTFDGERQYTENEFYLELPKHFDRYNQSEIILNAIGNNLDLTIIGSLINRDNNGNLRFSTIELSNRLYESGRYPTPNTSTLTVTDKIQADSITVTENGILKAGAIINNTKISNGGYIETQNGIDGEITNTGTIKSNGLINSANIRNDGNIETTNDITNRYTITNSGEMVARNYLANEIKNTGTLNGENIEIKYRPKGEIVNVGIKNEKSGIINCKNGTIDVKANYLLQNEGILKARIIKFEKTAPGKLLEDEDYDSVLLGEKVNINGQINLQNKIITGINTATDEKDIVNVKQMKDVINAKETKALYGSNNIIMSIDSMISNTQKSEIQTVAAPDKLPESGLDPDPIHPDQNKPEDIRRKNCINLNIPNMIEYQNGNNKIQTNNFTAIKRVNRGDVKTNSKDLINGSQLYSVQQSIAGFADRIQTNKTQLEALKSSINSKKEDLSNIQKNLNTIKGTKLSQDMSNLTTDGEAVIKSQVKKAVQKFQKDMDVSTVQANTQENKISGAMEAKPTEICEPSIMLADTPIETTNKPVNAVSAISKEDVAAKAALTQTKVNLEKKATVDTMNVSAYTKQLSKGLATGESAYHAIQKAKEDRLVQAKENTLTVGANGPETKIDASKKNWTGILVDEKEAGSMANVGYVNQTLSMENSYNKLNLMKKDLEKDTNKGIAKAAAMAALKPIGNNEEDKVSFAVGYGHYKDGNAAAIGTFYRPNQDILIHLDITAGAGKPGMNTGVSFKVGKGSSYTSMTREQLTEENAAMRNQAEKQDERIHTQKEKIEHLESVMQSIRF